MKNRTIYTLIPLADFKAVLGIDDREDGLSRYCLTTASFTIEQYCMRRLLKKKYHERLEFWGDYVFPLRSYPVREVLGFGREGMRQWGLEGLLNLTGIKRCLIAEVIMIYLFASRFRRCCGLFGGCRWSRYSIGRDTSMRKYPRIWLRPVLSWLRGT